MRVCEMLAFQSYNIKSPLNGEAAEWVDQHIDQLPTDREEFFLDLDDSPATSRADDESICANCGCSSPSLIQCHEAHALCDDCLVDCENCHSAKACLVCGSTLCSQCKQSMVGVE
jgi:hypothetical protein